MPRAITKPSRYGIRELSYSERRNKTVEKEHIGKMRLAVYSSYEPESDYQIKFFYSFSDRIRIPSGPSGTYGGKGVTFRWLYALLSGNSGMDGTGFLDRYFSYEVFFRLDSYIHRMYLILLRRDSTGRFISSGARKSELTAFERVVKRDCREWLQTGAMGTVTEATRKRREYAGISGDKVFYATGQLIDDLEITVALNKEVLDGAD